MKAKITIILVILVAICVESKVQTKDVYTGENEIIPSTFIPQPFEDSEMLDQHDQGSNKEGKAEHDQVNIDQIKRKLYPYVPGEAYPRPVPRPG